MADRLTELQDAINIQAEYFCNSIGVLQNIALPSFFTDLNWPARASKPDYQEILSELETNTQDSAREFAVHITNTAKQIDILISALPDEEFTLEEQQFNCAKLAEAYRVKGLTLVELIENKLEIRLVKVRQLLYDIAKTQLSLQALESEAYNEPASHNS